MRTFASTLVVSVLAVWSFATIVIDAAGRPSLSLASRVEMGSRGDLGYLAKVSLGSMAQAGLDVCARPVVRSTVSIRLAQLDLMHRRSDAIAWDAALAETGQLLRVAIGCFPYDGNLWLRLAAVEFSRGGLKPEVEDMLSVSAATTPAEAWIMRPRIIFAAALLEAGSVRARPVLNTDIRAFVGEGHYAEVAELYLQVGDVARGMIVDAIGRLEAGERSAELKHSIDRALMALPPERQP